MIYILKFLLFIYLLVVYTNEAIRGILLFKHPVYNYSSKSYKDMSGVEAITKGYYVGVTSHNNMLWWNHENEMRSLGIIDTLKNCVTLEEVLAEFDYEFK